MFFRSHSPPPSATGTMWSASHKLLRVRALNPQCRSSSVLRAPREHLSRRASAIASTPQPAHTPRSRANTCSRRYAGCVRSFHSCTQSSEQKVKRRRGTSRAHQRQMPRPFGPRGPAIRSTQPPRIARRMLTLPFYIPQTIRDRNAGSRAPNSQTRTGRQPSAVSFWPSRGEKCTKKMAMSCIFMELCHESAVNCAAFSLQLAAAPRKNVLNKKRSCRADSWSYAMRVQ
jgi:hypothetical protein